MSVLSAVSGVTGFVASETSWCDELPAAAEHCARTGQTLVVSSKNATHLARHLAELHPTLDLMVDSRHWASTVATPDNPTAISDTLFDIDAWAESELSGSRIDRMLAPVRFIRLGDYASLRAQLDILGRATHPRLVAHIATDADVLRAKHLPGFVEVLEASRVKRFAFQFAYKSYPLASYDRLNGLRRLLARFPGSMLIGLDVPAGTDAIVHGAGWVGIGASGGRRMERRPGDTGGGPRSADYLPGTWLRALMEMRTPTIYVDWYANSPTPTCPGCQRSLESYETTSSDKTLLIKHNLHGITDFAAEIMAVPEQDRAAWLNSERVEAFVRHAQLTGPGVSADMTLRRLCELDDPHLRETRQSGAWK
ncbi:MAG TPA: hypothetical protein VK662_03550 [Acidothermaceae bacterium]|nr:hypothetical protein [Acidothermaceae bacterium]